MGFNPFLESFGRCRMASLSDSALFNNLASRYTGVGGTSQFIISNAQRSGIAASVRHPDRQDGSKAFVPSRSASGSPSWGTEF